MINNKQTHGFCKIPQKKCTLSYCDENGCIYERRNLVGEPTISNNKQSMKLYTEEQVHSAMLLALGRHGIYIPNKHYQDLIDLLTPIELPSDEEIYKEARRYENYTTGMDELSAVQSASRYHGFMEGAAYVINKIQGGNK